MTGPAYAFGPQPRAAATGADGAASLRWQKRIAAHVAEVEQRLLDRVDDLQARWNGAALDCAGTVADPLPDALELYQLDPTMLLRQLLTHGGKRTRPVMALLGWAAADVGGSGHGAEDLLRAAAAIEMLHCFALVHDDVMDASATRRGQLTVHEQASLAHRRLAGRGDGARFGDSIAVLVGDLAHSEAEQLAAEMPAAMRAAWRVMVLELLAGQLRDVTGSAAADHGVESARRIARQKTGYYTIGRPLQLGALAAGGGEPALSALASCGRHAGEAFALRDDMLGAFGDPLTTGKPVGDDIRAGKPTVLLALATATLRGRAATALQAAGSGRMSDAQVRLVQDAMVGDGVVSRVEALIDERVVDAASVLRDAVTAGVLQADAVGQLNRVIDMSARREK